MNRFLAFGTAVILAAALLAGCSREEAEVAAAGPVLVLGIDGTEWSLLQPLLDAGELPNISALIESGASGRLRSLDPRRRSPVIWTTIATGKNPEEHGIGGFLVEDGRGAQPGATPYSSNMWKAPAFWDIVGDAGLSVGIICWDVTWPAWPVNGFMVSQHARYASQFEAGSYDEGLTYPADIKERVAAVARRPESITDEEMSRFLVDVGPPGAETLYGRNEDVLRSALSGDMTAVAVAEDLLAGGVPDLTCIYVRGVDEVCHRFWIYMDPETRPSYEPGDPAGETLNELCESLGGVIREYYRYTDENVGRLLKLFPENTTVVICSDHGFRGPGEWGQDGGPLMGIEQHGLNGVVIVNGPGAAAGASIENARVHDIAPTILAVAGMPVAEDMAGRVLSEAFTSDFLRTRSAGSIETYGPSSRSDVGERPIESPVDEEVRERLRSLGYIE